MGSRTLILMVLLPRVFCFNLSASLISDCIHCVRNLDHTYYKIKWAVSSNETFACRSSAMLISRFAVSVETACNEEDCARVHGSSDSTIVRKYWYFACNHNSGTNRHGKMVKIVRDYVEIVFLSLLCGVLVLKKQMLLGCIKKRSARFCMSNDTEVPLELTQESPHNSNKC